jgi:hypothetical protein
MITEENMESEMLNDLDYIYQIYRKLLEERKTNVRQLNTLIRALKHVHHYYTLDKGDSNDIKEIEE